MDTTLVPGSVPTPALGNLPGQKKADPISDLEGKPIVSVAKGVTDFIKGAVNGFQQALENPGEFFGWAAGKPSSTQQIDPNSYAKPVTRGNSELFVPSPKHTVDGAGGWGTPMDLSNTEAQTVLNNGFAVEGSKQVYGYSNGQFYVFQPDNAGGVHGYIIFGEIVPIGVLRSLKDSGEISKAQYGKFQKGK